MEIDQRPMHSLGQSDFRQVGAGPQQLMNEKFLQEVFHIPKAERESSGMFSISISTFLSNNLKYLNIGIIYDVHSSIDRSWTKTQSSQFITSGVDRIKNCSFRSCKLSHLLNGDECRPKTWIVASRNQIPTEDRMDGFFSEDITGPLILGKVEEILQIPATEAYTLGHPNFLLLHMAMVHGVAEPYGMPSVQFTSKYALIQFTV